MRLTAHEGTSLPDLKHTYRHRCGVTGAMALEMRPQAKKSGTDSLAGMQEKAGTNEVP